MINKKMLEMNLQSVQERIRSAAVRVGRDAKEIRLVVVSKGRSVEEIKILYELGVRDFGENRIEQAIIKTKSLEKLDDIRWHMIGHVQSRKAREVCQNFGYLHSLDSLKLAVRLDRFAGEEGRTLPVLLQFNVSGEDSKSGWYIDDEASWPDLHHEINQIAGLSNINIQGLMTMAPYDPDPENSREYFKKLTKLRNHIQKIYPNDKIEELSMGMSGDFEVAVEEGATLLRVGSAIFDY